MAISFAFGLPAPDDDEPKPVQVTEQVLADNDNNEDQEN